MTVATNSYYQKEIIAKYLDETAEDFGGLPFKLHDFGFRGSTSVEVGSIVAERDDHCIYKAVLKALK